MCRGIPGNAFYLPAHVDYFFNLRLVLVHILKLGIHPKRFVESLLPINEKNGRWRTLAGRTNDIPLTNMYIRAYCESHDIAFIDLFNKMTKPGTNVLREELSADGLHTTEAGYAIWENELKKHIANL